MITRFNASILILFVVGVVSGCTAGAAPAESTTAPTVAPSSPTMIASTATLRPRPTKGPPPQPTFGHLITYSEQPDPVESVRAFTEGTKKIYAMWDYSNMHNGLTIRREWYLDGKLWLKNEEPWDFAKYGESGTITGIAIEDQEKGLPTGRFELRLYIGTTWQFGEVDDAPGRSFSIGRDLTTSTGTGGMVMSPDGMLGALIDVGRLSIVDEQGQAKTLAEENIAGVSWMPDSKHLVYSIVTDDGSGAPWSTGHTLYMADVSAGATTKPDVLGHGLYKPVVSPTGRYVALNGGSGFGDACMVSFIVVIMKMNLETFAPIDATAIDTYNGLVYPDGADSVYSVGAPDLELPGEWQSPATIKVALRFTCSDRSGDGIYLANVAARSITKVADLPEPQ